MQNYIDDSELAKILSEANQVMSGMAGKREMDSKEMMELARKIAANTNSYTGEASRPPHFVEKSARKVKSKIGMHIDMLKNTASNISQIKERLKGTTPPKTFVPEVRKPSGAVNELSQYNRKIDETLKYLSTKTKGNTQIEQKIKKYRDIIGDVEGSLKELPQAIKEGKVKKSKALDQKLVDKVDKKAEQVMKKIQEVSPNDKLAWAERGYGSTSEEDGEIGDWSNFEGFNSKEDLEKYNEVFKEFVGEYPKEYEKRNREEGWYAKDGMGRAIDTTKPGNQRRRGLYSPRNNEASEADRLKKNEEMEKKLRDVLSKTMNGDGDMRTGSALTDKRFLDSYLESKMDTIHIGETKKDETDMKKKTQRKTANKKKTLEVEKNLCLDGPNRKGVMADDGFQKSPGSPAKSTRRPIFPLPEGLHVLYDKKKDKVEPGKSKGSAEEVNESDDHNINWDMERIKKLIVKERQETLRKKREAWEKNNELSEDLLEREKMILKKTFVRPSCPFDSPIPSTKTSSNDFITDRERQDKMYRKATKGKEGVYHKEDLEYEFGVNPFYFDPMKNFDHEGGDSKNIPISIKSYKGVRKRSDM